MVARSGAGFGEKAHWSFMSKTLNNQERGWLLARACERLADRPETLAKTSGWIRYHRRTLNDAVAICKRWGIDFPFVSQTDGKYATEVPKD